MTRPHGTAPNQSLGAEHSQPFHAYIMGIPGLKICTASKPQQAYALGLGFRSSISTCGSSFQTSRSILICASRPLP